ncbi:MAG: hypothetical protein ABW328_09620 [Ilumatobacteraceae bacterium]
MTRRNRVDPWGDLHAVPERGLLTGNRGCLVDGAGTIVRHHRSATLWIACLTSYRAWNHPLDAPRVWTPLFFLDDAVALAAGHRPCATCRRADYTSFRDAVSSDGPPLLAADIDRRLVAERLRRGRGLSRAADRPTWRAAVDELPDATVVVVDGGAHVLVGASMRPFTFAGWGTRRDRRATPTVDVLTPPTAVAALRGGFRPRLHPSATD